MSICFVVNEFSNSSKAGTFIHEYEPQISKTFPKASIYYINNLDNIDQVVSNAVNSFNTIVACGGDGTIQCVAKHVFIAGKTLGVIPLGSGNDFAKSIGVLPKQHISYYLDILKKSKITEIDFPSVNETLFLNTVGIGFDGLTNIYAQRMSHVKSGLKYTLAGIKAFFLAKTFTISVQTLNTYFTENVWMIVLANGAFEGGKFHISPSSINTDGKVELVIFPAFSRIKLGYAFLKLSFGLELNSSYYRCLSVQKARLNFPKSQPAHLDGELFSIDKAADLAINNRKIRAIMA